jgi:hypothetical protein
MGRSTRESISSFQAMGIETRTGKKSKARTSPSRLSSSIQADSLSSSLSIARPSFVVLPPYPLFLDNSNAQDVRPPSALPAATTDRLSLFIDPSHPSHPYPPSNTHRVNVTFTDEGNMATYVQGETGEELFVCTFRLFLSFYFPRRSDPVLVLQSTTETWRVLTSFPRLSRASC